MVSQADCTLLFSPQDVQTQRFLIDQIDDRESNSFRIRKNYNV